jgi:hypothetical protein
MLRKLGDLSDIVLPFLETQTSKAERRLSAPAVLLRQIDREFMKNLAMRAGNGSISGWKDRIEVEVWVNVRGSDC